VKVDLNHSQSVFYIFGCSCVRPVNQHRIQMKTERTVTHYVRLHVVLCSCRAAILVLIQNTLVTVLFDSCQLLQLFVILMQPTQLTIDMCQGAVTLGTRVD